MSDELVAIAVAIVGLVGVVAGTLLGGTGKYFTTRRDTWKEARASGLLLLAEVQALLDVEGADAQVVVETELGVNTWESHRQVLAAFRRGAYPNGFKATEWLCLAEHFACLKELDRERRTASDRDWWTRAQEELREAELLLWPFSHDPRIVLYFLRASLLFWWPAPPREPPVHPRAARRQSESKGTHPRS